MKFICDVHISYQIVTYLKSIGYDSVHVNDILDKSKTKDYEICKYSDEHDLILITKDSDFRNSFFIKRTPKKLVKINLGNVSNSELKAIFSKNIKILLQLYLKDNFLLEIDKDNISLIEMD